MARTVGVVLGLSFLFAFGIFSCSILSCHIRQKVGTFLVEETAGVFTTNLPMSTVLIGFQREKLNFAERLTTYSLILQ